MSKFYVQGMVNETKIWKTSLPYMTLKVICGESAKKDGIYRFSSTRKKYMEVELFEENFPELVEFARENSTGSGRSNNGHGFISGGLDGMYVRIAVKDKEVISKTREIYYADLDEENNFGLFEEEVEKTFNVKGIPKRGGGKKTSKIKSFADDDDNEEAIE